MINGIEHYTDGWSEDKVEEVYAKIAEIEKKIALSGCPACLCGNREPQTTEGQMKC